MPMSRVDRDLVRGRRAAERVRAAGGSAVEAALTHIEATFSPAMRHSIFKDRVAAVIRHGPLHTQASRYRRIAERHPIATGRHRRPAHSSRADLQARLPPRPAVRNLRVLGERQRHVRPAPERLPVPGERSVRR